MWVGLNYQTREISRTHTAPQIVAHREMRKFRPTFWPKVRQQPRQEEGAVSLHFTIMGWQELIITIPKKGGHPSNGWQPQGQLKKGIFQRLFLLTSINNIWLVRLSYFFGNATEREFYWSTYLCGCGSLAGIPLKQVYYGQEYNIYMY